jgi:hypothetical protein
VAGLAAGGRTADLEKLHAILSARHAGLDDRYSLVGAVEWMLNISLEKTEPQLSPTKRRSKTQELLFASP